MVDRPAAGPTPRRAALIGHASHLPARRLTNAELAQEFEGATASDIERKTGIAARAVAEQDEFASDMAERCSRALLDRLQVDPSLVNCVILTTMTPDYAIPSTASQLHRSLGLAPRAGAMDVALGCAGYTYCLALAAALVESGRSDVVLVVTAERMTAYTETTALATKALFGDAATASLVAEAAVDSIPEALPRGLLGPSAFGTEGAVDGLVVRGSGLRGHLARVAGDRSRAMLEMDGPAVFDFTLRVIGRHIEDFLEQQGLGVADVDLFVLHQANGFMLGHLRRRLKIPQERFFVHLEEVGNTVSSTIPLALEEAHARGRIADGDRVLLCGFGVGFSWSSILVDYVDDVEG